MTHDYVRYMTSSSILLGAEFDKIVSILMVTAVLALALRPSSSTFAISHGFLAVLTR